MRWKKRANQAEQPAENVNFDELPDPKLEAPQPTLRDEIERGDIFAMLVSAWFVFVPICLVLLLAIVFLSAFLLGLL